MTKMQYCPGTDPADIVERLREMRHRMPADRFAWKGDIEGAITEIVQLRADLAEKQREKNALHLEAIRALDAKDRDLAEMTRQNEQLSKRLGLIEAANLYVVPGWALMTKVRPLFELLAELEQEPDKADDLAGSSEHTAKRCEVSADG